MAEDYFKTGKGEIFYCLHGFVGNMTGLKKQIEYFTMQDSVNWQSIYVEMVNLLNPGRKEIIN